MEQKNSFLISLLSVLLLISSLVAGFFAYQTQGLVKEINYLKVLPTPTTTPSPSPDPTVNWKTYTNNEYSFSFKYPDDPTVNEEGYSYIVQLIYDNLSISLLPGGIPKNKTVSEYAKGGFCEPNGISQNKTMNNIEMVLTSKEFSVDNICLNSVFKQKNQQSDNSLLIIDIQGKASNQLGISLFNQILSTFKFIEPVKFDNLKSGDLITSPLELTGTIDKSWTFEANFSIEILDNIRKSLNKIPVNVLFENDKSLTGSFTTTIPFSTSSNNGFIVVHADNPSGLLENDKSLEIPVTFSKNQVTCTMEAKICPDGSAVGRSGPNCEFSPCPTTFSY